MPCSLANELVTIGFGTRGVETLALQRPFNQLHVQGDDFHLAFDGATNMSSSGLPDPTVTISNATHCIFRFVSVAAELTVDAMYQLRPHAAFVSKTLTLRHTGAAPIPLTGMRNLTGCAPFSSIRLTLPGHAHPTSSTVVASHYGLDDYAGFLRWESPPAKFGAFVTAQNPYLRIDIVANTPNATATTVAYSPHLLWRTDHALVADSGIIGVHNLVGRRLAPPADPIDEAEQSAMVAALRAYLVAPVHKGSPTVKINVAWTENDYQLDISKPTDRAAYKRIIDRASQFGLTHIVFAPRNSDVSCKRNNTDAWGWEQILWFGMGQKLRMGEWAPGDPLPDSLREMLDHFKLRGVKPVAYVYPILAFLKGTLANGTSPPWVVPGTYELSNHATDSHAALPLGTEEAIPYSNGPWRACLASPELQSWLPKTLLAFAKQTGAGGFSFDYTYFEQNGAFHTPGPHAFYASQYAQWAGWRTILAALQADPTACDGSRCVVDNRQQNHAWGPWMWVQGGTYAEPLMSDEQPGSWMFYEADMHTDRLSANRQRQVGWNYRQLEFCPAETLPGFALHQTDRAPTAAQRAICPDGRCSSAARVRDFDLLGYRYSLLSSIGSAGLNNVICGLPARDTEEFRLLPKEDLAFFRSWLQWTDQHVGLLRHTRALPGLSVPSYGALDGVSMVGEGDDALHGAIFLFNPTSDELSYTIPFNASLGLACPDGAGSPVQLLIRHAGGSERSFLPSNLSVVPCGSSLKFSILPTTAAFLSFSPYMPPPEASGSSSAELLVLGAAVESATYDDIHGVLALHQMRGEVGTDAAITAVLPPRADGVGTVLLNGRKVAFSSGDRLGGSATVRVAGRWGATASEPRFRRNARLCDSSSKHLAGGVFTCQVSVPASVFHQLAVRNASFPLTYDLGPNSTNDAGTPWLAPGRLLLWVKYRGLISDALNVSGTVNGQPILVRKAYNTIVPSARRFIGHFADVTNLFKPGATQMVKLTLPTTGTWTTRTGALSAGGDLEVVQGTVAEVEAACAAHADCQGFTFRKPEGLTCDKVQATPIKAYLKLSTAGNSDPSWCKVDAPPALVGVFFENVETITTSELAQ